MQNLVGFIKKHYLLLVILTLVLYILQPKSSIEPYSNSIANSPKGVAMDLAVGNARPDYNSNADNTIYPQTESVTVSTDRKKVENYELNVAVKNVQDSIKSLENKTNNLGGFVVNSYFSNPGESESGFITIRIPINKKQEFLTYVKDNSVKVVSENVNGDDVTDQYTDIEQRLQILQNNKTRFEEIMKKADKIQDILQVQNEIFNLQTQIDSLVGQKQYIEKTSSTIRYSINLSTDEYAFSYLPKDGWNPKAVFKEAVRGLVLSLRGVANKAIWILVYSIIWVPIILAATFLYFRFWRKK